MRFFKFFNILMVIFIYPLYCYADFSKESLSYRGNPLLIQKDFFQQITKTCIGKDEGLEEKELKMFYEKCIFYKTKSMYQKLWKLPDNQNVLLGEKKDIKLYIKKKVTNRLNQEIQLVLEKSNMITDTFTIQTLIEAHPDYEIAALAGENGLLDYNNSYYIDDDLNITFITISEQEGWLLLPVYYKKYQLNEAAGKYYLFDFKFWRPIYGDSIVYQFIFDIKNNSSSINILPNQTVQKKLSILNGRSCKTILEKNDEDLLDACYSVAITKFSQEVEKEFNNILDILKRSNNNLNEIARENQLAWDSYKTNVCLYNELDYDPRYFDKENKYFFDISLCVIDASNNRLDQLDQIKKQFLNTKIFYLLNINFKIEDKYDVEPNQVYNKLIMKIHSINSSNKEQKLAFLEKIHQSWQVYRNSSCLLETVPYRENDKEYKSFMDSCLMQFNTVYLKKLNDYLNNEIKK